MQRALDILVNNAGIMDKMTPVGDLSDGLWERGWASTPGRAFWAHSFFMMSAELI